MSQHFSNLSTKNAHGSIPGDIQTKYVTATGTGSPQSVAITWDAAYLDTAYGVTVGVEAVSGDGSTVSVGGFTKSPTGIVISLTGGSSQSLRVHAAAFAAGPGNS